MNVKRIVGFGCIGLLLVVVALMIGQYNHYKDVRLHAVQDHQEAWHGDVFHVLTFVQAAPGNDFMTPLKNLVLAAKGGPGKLIYAGQVIHMGLRSAQISQTFGDAVDWQAIVLQQFANQEVYQAYLEQAEIKQALAGFAVTYSHGFKRSASLNVLLHQMLLAIKTWRQVTFSPDILPFQASPQAQRADISEALLKHANGLGRDAILIVNLARNGTAEQQAANNDYASQMLGLMAEQGYGPMHIGSTVSLEHNHQFDQAMLVYYPGSQYFHDLGNSTWFQGIIGDKQLADTQACITVPITHLLR